jgi:hypothetical protein
VIAAALFALVLAAPAFAQGVGINATGAAADTSALLDVSSVTKGLLAPRMTASQRGTIVLPANGLLVYQTDGTAGLYVNAGTPAAPGWQLVGSGGASQWTSNGTAIYYNTGRVGIGRSAPASPLDILGGNWDVVGGEGDFRIGDASTRLKIGIALGGGGTGAATIMEQGAVGAYNVLALGTQGNKVLFVNGASQRVGIGVDAPTAPLGFGTAFGKKISLYSGPSGDAGFGVGSSRLQIYSDNPNSAVALGYDAAGIFYERFAFQPNGAMALSGNTGAPGQVLQSNGDAAAATWAPAPAVHSAPSTDVVTLPAYAGGAVPGMSSTFTTAVSSKGVVNFTLPLQAPECFACPGATPWVYLRLDGVIQNYYVIFVPNGKSTMLSGTQFLTLAPGSHTIDLGVSNDAGNSISAGLMWPTHGEMTIQVFAQ